MDQEFLISIQLQCHGVRESPAHARQEDEREGEWGTGGFAFLLEILQLGVMAKALSVVGAGFVDAGFVVLRLSVGLVLPEQGSFLGWSWRVWGQQSQRGAEVGDSTLKSKKGQQVQATPPRCCFFPWVWKSHPWCLLEGGSAVALGFVGRGAARGTGNVQSLPTRYHRGHPCPSSPRQPRGQPGKAGGLWNPELSLPLPSPGARQLNTNVDITGQGGRREGAAPILNSWAL